jgi:hypothetical protein
MVELHFESRKRAGSNGLGKNALNVCHRKADFKVKLRSQVLLGNGSF